MYKQKGVSELTETDLDKVSEDVEVLTAQKEKEIDDLKLMESFRRVF